MRKFLLLALLAASGAFVAPGPSSASAIAGKVCMAPAVDGVAQCCKVCRKGKACGDTCIARNLTCHRGKGCACNG